MSKVEDVVGVPTTLLPKGVHDGEPKTSVSDPSLVTRAEDKNSTNPDPFERK